MNPTFCVSAQDEQRPVGLSFKQHCLINELLDLPEYQRKQIALVLMASMLGDFALDDTIFVLQESGICKG